MKLHATYQWFKRFKRSGWLDANTLLLRTAGLVALLSIPFKPRSRLPRLSHGVESANNILPLHLARTSHLVSFCLGIGLLYIASQVRLRKRNSFYLAVGALVALIVAELLHFRNPLQIVLYVATLGVILWNRRQFVVMSDVVSLRRGLLISVGVFASVLVFATTVFVVIDQQAFGKRYTTPQTISIVTHQLRGDQVSPDVRLRRYDRMLLGSLRTAGVAMVAIILVSLFRPHRLRRGALASHIAYARKLLEQYSTSPEDYFKLWPADKHYFFYRESFVAYKVANGVALVLDGASGRPQDLSELRRHFLEYARINGWQTAVIHADEAEAKAWQIASYDSDDSNNTKQLFIGSEAFVQTDEFVQKTSRSKHFRYVRNRATKDGLSFAVWQPPLNDEQLAELTKVSDSWLATGGRREYTYMMGYFDRDYLRGCHVAVLRTDNSDGNGGAVVAYTNIIPVFAERVASIDHIRIVPSAPSVAMHYLLMETIAYAAEQGIATFNLGLAPLSKLEEKDDKNLNERLLGIVKQLGGRYYSFAGLEQFKGKFTPQWSPRYIVYQRSARLFNVAAALNNAVTYAIPAGHRQKDRWRQWLIGLAVLAGASYASFPVGLLLNPSHAFSGLVSFLGQSNQPSFWVFNELDVISAAISIFVLLVIPVLYHVRGRLERWAIGLAVASSIGALIAALTPLPDLFDDLSLRAILEAGDVQVIIHGVASFINSAGYVVAAGLWAYGARRRYKASASRWEWRAAIAISLALLSTVGFGVGEWWPASSPIIQRIFIIMYAVWLVAFVVDLTTRGHKRARRDRRKSLGLPSAK